MQTNIALQAIEPARLLISARVVALNTPDALVHPHVIQALARQACRGEQIGVIVGHNNFALHTLTRWARLYGCAPASLLTRIELSRAFTCYQLHRRAQTLTAERISEWRALYVLGLLDTFYDESVKTHEAARLLVDTLAQFKRIARTGLPVLITLSAPLEAGREDFAKLVAQHTDVYRQATAPMLEAAIPPQRTLPGFSEFDSERIVLPASRPIEGPLKQLDSDNHQ